MDTSILTPDELFNKTIRYAIPTFQRPYVWGQDEQWEPLWEDVQNTAETYLEELDRSGNDDVKALSNTNRHFLGAVVIQQVPTASRQIDRREVIDGQQRMTTLQLLIDATQYVCEELGLKYEAELLSGLVKNTGPLVRSEDDELKLWPTRGDREAFRHAMHNGLAINNFENSRIVQAHEYFQLQVREWLNLVPDDDSVQRRAEALQITIADMLQMVVIDLYDEDDPYVIFETMNARGTPLLQSDLIKNYVLSRTQSDDNSIWGNLDSGWWRTEVGRGRNRRPRIDMLLNYWLSMKIHNEVSAGRVFNAFTSFADEVPIESVMADVTRDLDNYRNFETETQARDEDMFRYRANVMQTATMTPALLLFLSASPEIRLKSLKALESFLIRRMVCRASTRGYGNLALELAIEIQDKGLENADKTVVEFLRRESADYRVWPDDAALEHALVNFPLYRMLTRGRLRLVLEGVEEAIRKSSMSEQTSVPRNLTIEHVMPRSWAANWPLPPCVDAEYAASNRNRMIHTIGNLTLINGRLNASLSNAAWESKRKTLARHSTLLLNHRLLEESEGTDWDEDFIQARSRRMAKLVAEVWPGPDSPVWDS